VLFADAALAMFALGTGLVAMAGTNDEDRFW